MGAIHVWLEIIAVLQRPLVELVNHPQSPLLAIHWDIGRQHPDRHGCVKLIRPRNDGLNWLHPVTCGQDPFGIG